MQGIGFRPTALRLANELGIGGEVKNSGGNVSIVASAKKEALDKFIQCLTAIFEIEKYDECAVGEQDFDNFTIVHSTNDNEIPFITPDIATCEECESELKNENNRRFHHPFISCVNCGPRYTIINSLPYDRERITMGKFPLCGECEAEYTEPKNRRCHAQTIACNNCGPTTNISIDTAVSILRAGKPLAIKDIGGYHIAGICTRKTADKIRKIKGREKKPFAVMFRDIDEIGEYCLVSENEKSLLKSKARPIVLLKKKKDFAAEVCGESDYIGAFLPCNPIQIMILEKISPLIMTSANISGEAIIINDDKIKKFGIDILSHDREILTPIDDSVVQINSGKVQLIRRARGYVPLAIKTGITAKKNILALGGDLKSSFAICHDGYVIPSQYFGDLEDCDCFEAYRQGIKRFCDLHSFKPDIIVKDKHPLYYSSSLADGGNAIEIQHHLAHAYGVVAEHKIEGDALHFVFDGTGYGDDGAIWGGEVFLNQKRVEHLKYTKMTAGDEISKNADLALACCDNSNELVNKAREQSINTVNSSSMGRLFDAVCAALGLKHKNSYEGECAIALESAARKAKKPFYIEPSFDPSEIIAAVKAADAPKEEIALGFHMMLCDMILKIAQKYGVEQITLSGGCFVNRILLEGAVKRLEKHNFKVFTNEQVSCGDNGLCLGQAYLAAEISNKTEE